MIVGAAVGCGPGTGAPYHLRVRRAAPSARPVSSVLAWVLLCALAFSPGPSPPFCRAAGCPCPRRFVLRGPPWCVWQPSGCLAFPSSCAGGMFWGHVGSVRTRATRLGRAGGMSVGHKGYLHPQREGVGSSRPPLRPPGAMQVRELQRVIWCKVRDSKGPDPFTIHRHPWRPPGVGGTRGGRRRVRSLDARVLLQDLFTEVNRVVAEVKVDDIAFLSPFQAGSWKAVIEGLVQSAEALFRYSPGQRSASVVIERSPDHLPGLWDRPSARAKRLEPHAMAGAGYAPRISARP